MRLGLFGIVVLCSCMRWIGHDDLSADSAAVDVAGPSDNALIQDMKDGNVEAADASVVDLAVQIDGKPASDSMPPDEGPMLACPSEMKVVADFCVDGARGPVLMWTRAAEHCMKQGKRLCSIVEWEKACSATTGMTGQWEWTSQLKSATTAWKRGKDECLSSSSHEVTSGAYATRCCLTPSPPTATMAKITTAPGFWIDKDEGIQGSWMVAAAHCMTRKLRLCGDGEWETACLTATAGLLNMTDGWEWVRELKSDAEGKKRGSGSCTAASAHGFDGNYGVRCCGQEI